MDNIEFIDEEDLENVSEEEYERLEELVEVYQTLLEVHDDELNNIISEINNSKVYNELGIEISVGTEYYYSLDKNDEN